MEYQFDGVRSVVVSAAVSFVSGLSTFKSLRSISGSVSCSSGFTTNEPSMMTAGVGVTIQTEGSFVIGASGGGELGSLITIS